MFSSRTITFTYLLDLIRLDPERFLYKLRENSAILSCPVYQPQILRMIQFQNNAALFQALLEEWSDTLLSARVDGNTILHIACIQVWEESARWIFLRYPELCEVPNDRGLEPFWEALYACGFDVVQTNLFKKYFHVDSLLKIFLLNPRVAETKASYITIPVSKPGWNAVPSENWQSIPSTKLLLNPTVRELIQVELQTSMPERLKNPVIEHSAINVFYVSNPELWKAFAKHRPDIIFSTQNMAKMFHASFLVSGLADDTNKSIQRTIASLPHISTAMTEDPTTIGGSFQAFHL